MMLLYSSKKMTMENTNMEGDRPCTGAGERVGRKRVLREAYGHGQSSVQV